MSEQSVFVARERELAILNDALNRALAGQGSVVFIAGEKGTGKTRLAREFIAAALTRPETIVPAAGFSNPNTGEGEPFLPWRGVMEMLASEVCKGKLPHVQALFPIPKGWGRESELHRERLRKVGKLLIRILTEVAPELASAWLGVSVPGLGLGLGFLIDRLVGEKRVVAPQEWRERVFSQYPAAIARLADAFPLILFLDDFHWADNSSHGMLYHLAEMATRHRLLILVTLRPQDREALRLIALQQELETKRWATSFSLDLLDIIPEHRARMKEFVNQFLDRNYAPNALDERFRACLVEQTEGHAFIVEETLKQFEQEGTLRQDGSRRWVLAAEPDWSRLPRTVEGMVERRLEGVSEDDLRLLRAAAVEGAWDEEFTAQVIARVLDLRVRRVRERLDGELGRRRELVLPSRSVRVEETGQPLDFYRLRHRAFQEHLYALLSPGERRDLHAGVALALRELLGEAWKEEPDLLAYHARRGERWPCASCWARHGRKSPTCWPITPGGASAGPSWPRPVSTWPAVSAGNTTPLPQRRRRRKVWPRWTKSATIPTAANSVPTWNRSWGWRCITATAMPRPGPTTNAPRSSMTRSRTERARPTPSRRWATCT